MNKTLTQILERARQDDVTISLILTRQCGFECDHCFYGCSPRESGSYMSDDVLDKVREFYEELNRLEIHACINLIGGEPTIRMNQFKRVLENVARWSDFEGQPAKIEMVTNGWWLHRRETAERFLEIVRPFALANDPYDPRFTVSVSDDEYHRSFRPYGFPAVSRLLDEFFETELYESVFYDRPVFSRKMYRCQNCYEAIPNRPSKCDFCGGKEMSIEYEVIDGMPPRDGDIPWLTAKSTELDYSGVIPSGIRGGFGTNDVAKNGGCSGIHEITFLPNGALGDGCCRGSDMPFGTVADHPLVLMALIDKFKKIPRSCRECRTCAQYYAQSTEFKKLKASLKSSIRGDESIDWYQPKVATPRYRLITLQEQALQEVI